MRDSLVSWRVAARRGGEQSDARRDVGWRDGRRWDGRIIAIGEVDEPPARTIDVSDLVVAPGFIDVHTHYDAQAFWDPTLSPSPPHGETTVRGGNCGFSIAPLGGPEDGDYLMRMLARVEGMPLEPLRQGVPWDWSTIAEYLDRLERRLGANAGFLVGHSAIRRAVMHEDAVGREATESELDAARHLLHDGLAAGAWVSHPSGRGLTTTATAIRCRPAMRAGRRSWRSARSWATIPARRSSSSRRRPVQRRAVRADGRHEPGRQPADQLERAAGLRAQREDRRPPARRVGPRRGAGRASRSAHPAPTACGPGSTSRAASSSTS